MGGRDYTTETLQFGRTVGSGDSVEAELRRLRYAPGTSVPVSYDPRNPSVAVAEPGLHSEFCGSRARVWGSSSRA